MAVQNPSSDPAAELPVADYQELLARANFDTTREFLQAIHSNATNADESLRHAFHEVASESVYELFNGYVNYQLRCGRTIESQELLNLFAEPQRPCMESCIATAEDAFRRRYCPLRARWGTFPCSVDQFEITGEIERTEDWVIYRALDGKQGDREVRFELSLRNLAPDGDFASTLRSFVASQDRLREFDHPNVCPTLDFGTLGQRPYVVTPVERRTKLDKFCRTPPVLNAEESVVFIQQVLSGLIACNNIGIFHGAIKPSCISVVGDQAKLHFVGRQHILTSLEPSNSPVQADCYAVGCVLYELLTGLRPNPWNSSKPIAPSSLRGLGNAELDLIVQKSVEWYPSKRFTSAKQFRDSLTKWSNSQA